MNKSTHKDVEMFPLLIDREENIKKFMSEIKDGFIDVYQKVRPDKTVDDFNSALSQSLNTYCGNTKIIKQDIAALEKDPNRKSTLSDILLMIHEGSAYLFKAMVYSKNIDHDQAWVYLMQANKTLGKLQTICELDASIVEYIKKNKNIVQSKGGTEPILST